MSSSKFRDLADSSGDGVLVTFSARLGVVDRAETFDDIVPLLKRPSIVIVRSLANKSWIIG